MSERIRLTPLGGVGRFGRNCLLIEHLGLDGTPGDALVVDCGVRFVGDDAPGFDVGLPDLERLGSVGDRLKGYVITHGHEDHIGGLPYALRERQAPVFCTSWTARLIARRCARVGGAVPAIDVVDFGERRSIGPFTFRLLAVSHSIPDASCLVLDTPAGTLVHSGDFRVDDDPVLGEKTDMPGLTAVGDAGVVALLADSTGALTEGKNAGERSVWPSLQASIEGALGRVFVTLFASHLQRLALLLELARQSNRKVGLLGKGLQDTRGLAEAEARLLFGDGLLEERALQQLPRHRQLWCVTGSQGESGAALARLSRGDESMPPLERGDRVVVSARVIPGNELRVAEILEALAERGADIVDGRRAPHVSGHGSRQDLEALVLATRPACFVALHGNARNLLAHQELVASAGVEKDRVVDLRDGSSLVISADAGIEGHAAPRAHEPVAAFGEVEYFPRDTIAARQRMGTAGVLVVVDADPVHLVCRGIFPRLSEDLERALRQDAAKALALHGTEQGAAALHTLTRHFRRHRRVPPEIVLLPENVLLPSEGSS